MSQVSRTLTGAPGEIVVGVVDADGTELRLNEGRPATTLVITNRGDRPIQVGSHFHFAEVNAALSFDREASWGLHLDIAAGTSVRFEAGIEKTVHLVRFVGSRRVPGLRGLVAGSLDRPIKDGRG